MKKRLLALLLAALTALSLAACGAEEQPVTSQIFAMDTVMDFAVYGENAQAALTAASQEINALEQRLSRTRAGSEISTPALSEVSVAVSLSVRSGEEKNTVLTAQGASPSKSVFPSASCTVTALPDWMPSEETPPGCAMPP